MKLGTENKKKTVFAAVLLGVALIFVVRWLFMDDSGSTPPPTKVPGTSVKVEAPATSQAGTAQRSANSRRSDQKTVAGAVFTPSLDPTLNLKQLETSESVKYEGTGRNIFESTPEPKKIEIPQPKFPGRVDQGSMTSNPVPTGPPPPPQINLKFYGFSTKGGQKTIFLSQGTDAVFTAHEGDIIARRYKIVRINPSSVEVQDLLSNNKQTITLTAS